MNGVAEEMDGVADEMDGVADEMNGVADEMKNATSGPLPPVDWLLPSGAFF